MSGIVHAQCKYSMYSVWAGKNLRNCRKMGVFRDINIQQILCLPQNLRCCPFRRKWNRKVITLRVN
jgi:hypothetical protein